MTKGKPGDEKPVLTVENCGDEVHDEMGGEEWDGNPWLFCPLCGDTV